METEKNPYLALWKSPRAMIRTVLSKKSFWAIFALTFFGAWGASLFELADGFNQESYASSSVIMNLLSSIAGAVGVLLVAAAFIAFFYWIVGKIFKGTGTFMDLYKGAMISSMPHIIVLPFALIWLIGSPESFINNDLTTGFWSFIMIITNILLAIASIYSIVLTIVMISEVHNFSKWKAFFTMFIPMFIIIVIVLVFAVLLFSLVLH